MTRYEIARGKKPPETFTVKVPFISTLKPNKNGRIYVGGMDTGIDATNYHLQLQSTPQPLSINAPHTSNEASK